MRQKFKVLAEIRQHPSDTIASFMLFFVGPAIAMLCLGALGHRYHNALLAHIGYFDALLAKLAYNGFRPSKGTHYMVGWKSK